MKNSTVNLSTNIFENAKIFRGISRPNNTQVPDEFLDELMPDLTGAEFKVLLYITRRTFGFMKQSDNISMNQICNGITTRDGRVLDRGTGLARSAAQRAVKKLVEKQIIKMTRRKSHERGDEATTYEINFTDENEIKSNPKPVPQKKTGGGTKIGQGGALKKGTQETVLQETEIQYSNNSNVNKLENKIETIQKEKKEYIKFQANSVQIIHQRSRTNLRSMADILNKSYTVPVTGKKSEIDKNKSYESVYAKKENTYSNFQKASPALSGFTKQISMEFGDMNHIASNIQQMKNILALVKSRGVSEESFLDFAFGIKGLVKENQYTIQGSKIGYYFKVLRTNLKII